MTLHVTFYTFEVTRTRNRASDRQLGPFSGHVGRACFSVTAEPADDPGTFEVNTVYTEQVGNGFAGRTDIVNADSVEDAETIMADRLRGGYDTQAKAVRACEDEMIRRRLKLNAGQSETDLPNRLPKELNALFGDLLKACGLSHSEAKTFLDIQSASGVADKVRGKTSIFKDEVDRLAALRRAIEAGAPELITDLEGPKRLAVSLQFMKRFDS